MTHSGPTVALAGITTPGATLAVACTPGAGLGQSACSIRAQSRDRATDGSSTMKKTWLARGSAAQSDGRRTTDASVPAICGRYFELLRNDRSPARAVLREAMPRI